MNDISQRILSLMSEKQMSYGELSKTSGIPKSALQRYATGQTEKIPIDRLELIARSLGTTAAYLMGWDSEVSNMDNEFAAKVRDLRAMHGLTLEQVANVVGVGASTVRKWETGMIQNIRRDKIAKLAEALHTTPAYLMGWDSVEINQDKQRIIDMLDQLSPDNLRLFAAALEATIQAKKP